MIVAVPQKSKRWSPDETRASVWLIAMVVVPLVCQMALMTERLAVLRIGLRTGAFLTSLAGLVLATGNRPIRHPSFSAGVVAMAIVGLNILHPSSNSPLSSMAQATLYLAILAPLYWVPRLEVTPRVLGQLIAVLWVWHTLSALVGVLQVYYPGSFQPAVSTSVRNNPMADGLKIVLADGTEMWRPMGLTDSPGGAATAGMFAFLFGMGMFVNSNHRWLKPAALLGMMVGLFCIYLCQVRSLLVMAGVSAIAFAAVLAMAGWHARAARLYVAVPAVAIGSFIWAVAVGGESVSRRYATLLQGDPTTVYYRNRGIFLEHTIDILLPQYPVGAGLGRWGMMRNYFGDPHNVDSQGIYVEIQLTGWLLDGGVPLILAYSCAVFAACWAAGRLALRVSNPWLSGVAALLLAYDLGAAAVTFNYPLFIGQGGMEFWLLNAAVFTASVRQRRLEASARQARSQAVIPHEPSGVGPGQLA